METTTPTTDNQLAVIIQESGLKESKATVLLENFNSYYAIAADWKLKADALIITDASQLTEMRQARDGRLFLREKRLAIEKTRKALKEDSLREGRAIDTIAGALTDLITPIEKALEEKEKFAERLEAERKEKLRSERAASLLKYTNDADIYPLGDMSEDAFSALLRGYNVQQQAAVEAQLEADRQQAERIRLEALEQSRRIQLAPYAQFLTEGFDYRNVSQDDFDAMLDNLKQAAADYQNEQERIRAENERLKMEAEARELQIAEERKAVEEANRKATEAAELKAKEQREKAEAERKRIEAEQNVKIAAERAAREKAEAELKAKQEAEAKAEADRLAAIEAEAAKGDADKFADIIVSLTALKTRYAFKSAKYKKLQAGVNELLDKTIAWATK